MSNIYVIRMGSGSDDLYKIPEIIPYNLIELREEEERSILLGSSLEPLLLS